MSKSRRDAASALQKLIFRAVQTGVIPSHQDCQAVTDNIMLAVVEAMAKFYEKEFQDDEHVH